MMASEEQVPDLGDEVPGLGTATDHIIARLDIAVDDVIDGLHDKDWLLETMRQDIRYFVWLYTAAAGRVNYRK
jgi:hypothetical protein